MGEIRFVGTGETRGYPYLVCKKLLYQMGRQGNAVIHAGPRPIFHVEKSFICCMYQSLLVTEKLTW